MVVTSHAVPDAGPARVRIARPPARWSAEERGILDDPERSNRLQNVYSARNNRELASRYDEWAEDYEDDMLSLGYAIPAVAAGFVGRYVSLRRRVLDAGVGTGLFGSILSVLGYEDLVGIDISKRMLDKAGEKDVYRGLHRMVLGEPLGFDTSSFSAAVSVGGLHKEPRPTRSARGAHTGRGTGRLGDLQCPRRCVPEGWFRGEASVTGESGQVAEGDD